MKFARPYCARNFAALKIIVAITGASGAIYTQRLLDKLHLGKKDVVRLRSMPAADLLQAGSSAESYDFSYRSLLAHAFPPVVDRSRNIHSTRRLRRSRPIFL